jgi:hypothetical protein
VSGKRNCGSGEREIPVFPNLRFPAPLTAYVCVFPLTFLGPSVPGFGPPQQLHRVLHQCRQHIEPARSPRLPASEMVRMARLSAMVEDKRPVSTGARQGHAATQRAAVDKPFELLNQQTISGIEPVVVPCFSDSTTRAPECDNNRPLVSQKRQTWAHLSSIGS